MNNFITILLIFGLIYFFLIIFTYLFQRNLLYHPEENNYSGDKILVNIEKIKITTNDQIDLISWYHNKNKNNFKPLTFQQQVDAIENQEDPQPQAQGRGLFQPAPPS